MDYKIQYEKDNISIYGRSTYDLPNIESKDEFYLDKIKEEIEECLKNNKYIFVAGISGSGKTTLLAYIKSLTKEKIAFFEEAISNEKELIKKEMNLSNHMKYIIEIHSQPDNFKNEVSDFFIMKEYKVSYFCPFSVITVSKEDISIYNFNGIKYEFNDRDRTYSYSFKE